MFLRVTQYEDGTLETQVHPTQTEAEHMGRHAVTCEDDHSIMWMTVSDAFTGDLHSMWRMTDDGIKQLYLNHHL